MEKLFAVCEGIPFENLTDKADFMQLTPQLFFSPSTQNEP
jgi:hypothetical protein